ncbi:MAG: phosphodiester glycosidase family protein [Candidatus Margulisiibacteriota bacterium]|nr:phosphodiester glycosidase family protein [Candidatus Margulisiibacteriota bacterium]
MKSVGFRPWINLQGALAPKNNRVLEKSRFHKIEQATVNFGYNPLAGNTGQSRVTILIFDPQAIKLYPLFSEGMDQVKEHWQLNPGACFSHIQNFAQYLQDFRQTHPPAKIIAATNGNNLFSHPYDILLRTEGSTREFYTSRQNPDGARSCFTILQDGRIDIGDLTIKGGNLREAPDVIHAIYGQQTVRDAKAVDLIESSLYRSFTGNFTHIFRLPRFTLLKPGHSFSVERVEKCGGSLGAQQMADSPELAEAAIKGQEVAFTIPKFATMRRFIKPNETCPIVTQSEIINALESGIAIPGKIETVELDSQMVQKALIRSGYTEHDFSLDMENREVTFKQIRRSRCPLTMLGISATGAGIAATFDGIPFKDGPIMEEAAETMVKLGAKAAVALGNGSEVTMYSESSSKLVNQRAASLGKGGRGNTPEDAASVTSIIYYKNIKS